MTNKAYRLFAPDPRSIAAWLQVVAIQRRQREAVTVQTAHMQLNDFLHASHEAPPEVKKNDED